MDHEIGVNQVADAGIDISNLEKRKNIEVPGIINPNPICHTPGTISVCDDRSDARPDVQKMQIRLGR